MQENEKTLNVKIENYTGDKPIEIIYRVDEPQHKCDLVPVKLPEPINLSGTIKTVREFISKRKDLNVADSHIEVCRDNAEIKLVINECDSHNGFDPSCVSIQNNYFMKRGCVVGRIEFSEQFKKLKINDETFWSPIKLAQYLRLNRSLFADTEEGMAVVSLLKNVKAKISGEYEKKKETVGTISKTEFFQQSVEHNLPKGFAIMLNIFKGDVKEKFEVEFEADIIDSEIMVKLVSPAINDAFEGARDALINVELDEIQKLLPDMVIIEK